MRHDARICAQCAHIPGAHTEPLGPGHVCIVFFCVGKGVRVRNQETGSDLNLVQSNSSAKWYQNKYR